MGNRITISTVRKANDKMKSGGVILGSTGKAFAVTVRTGKLNKTYNISNEKINQAYKLSK